MERILIPIRLRRTIERIMKRRPEMAEVMSSLPWLSFSGMPAEVVMMKTPPRMRRRAMVPPRPIASWRSELIKPPDSTSVEIQPRAVLISPFAHPPLGLMMVVGVAANSQKYPPPETTMQPVRLLSFTQSLFEVHVAPLTEVGVSVKKKRKIRVGRMKMIFFISFMGCVDFNMR